ncbi:MAG: hypothetical protein ABIR62_11760 [Dokdonella sp.]|uniref:hypothetical protein n=1 Tax=Dokdonella sp. TaxID=2291710 RepID=UPI003265C658
MISTRMENDMDAVTEAADRASEAIEDGIRDARPADAIDDTVDALADEVHEATATLSSLIEDAQDTIRDVQEPIRRFVNAHPVASLVAIAGIATLLLRRPR